VTIGWYALRKPKGAVPIREPWPYCRRCVQQLGLATVVAIDEQASPSIRCRGCRARLREWQ
jgi:hypothetical protein